MLLFTIRDKEFLEEWFLISYDMIFTYPYPERFEVVEWNPHSLLHPRMTIQSPETSYLPVIMMTSLLPSKFHNHYLCYHQLGATNHKHNHNHHCTRAQQAQHQLQGSNSTILYHKDDKTRQVESIMRLDINLSQNRGDAS